MWELLIAQLAALLAFGDAVIVSAVFSVCLVLAAFAFAAGRRDMARRRASVAVRHGPTSPAATD